MSAIKHEEYEYEYFTANTREQWHKIVDAIFCGDCEIQRTIAKYDNGGIVSFSVCWDPADRVDVGREYRRKKPAPKKAKKLVDRTEEEIIPLIGRYIVRKKKDGLYFLVTSNQIFGQEDMEIAPIGSEEWEPMQKEIEVDK